MVDVDDAPALAWPISGAFIFFETRVDRLYTLHLAATSVPCTGCGALDATQHSACRTPHSVWRSPYAHETPDLERPDPESPC